MDPIIIFFHISHTFSSGHRHCSALPATYQRGDFTNGRGMGSGSSYCITTDQSHALWNSFGGKMSDKHCANSESHSGEQLQAVNQNVIL